MNVAKEADCFSRDVTRSVTSLMMGDQVISTSDMDNHLNPLDTDSDDEYDWEEVDVPEIQPQTIEITLNAQPKTDPEKRSVPSLVLFQWWLTLFQEERDIACGTFNTNRLSQITYPFFARKCLGPEQVVK